MAAKRRGAKRRGTREALTLRPSGDYLTRVSVLRMKSSRERRHFILSVRILPFTVPDGKWCLRPCWVGARSTMADADAFVDEVAAVAPGALQQLRGAAV